MPFDAEEFYTVDPPGFVWEGTLRSGPLPVARARDRYQQGKGNMLIKLGALYTIADAVGEEIDQGAMMRYFSEMVWFPTSLLGETASFAPIDDHAVRATFTDHGRSLSATLRFADDGRLTEFVAERYRMVGDRYELRTWSNPITDYGEWEGLQLPVQAKAIWKLPEGDLEYFDVAITALEYDRVSARRRAPGASSAHPDPAERSAYMRLFYRGWRPTRLGRWANSVQGWYSGLGLPPRFLAVLEVRGRASGRTRANPVVIATVDGAHYLVSMLGPESDWVKNVEAAQGNAVIRQGRRRHVHLVAVEPEQRAPILREYIQVASSGRRHFPLCVGASLSEFAAIAGRYPVYRIDPV
jgi:deazaflavin-dependent oxidoreductase (nitroreductase family)